MTVKHGLIPGLIPGLTPELSVCLGESCTHGGVLSEVRAEGTTAAHVAMRAGLNAQNVLFDPGLGFNKRAQHCHEIIARLDEFKTIGYTIVLEPSMKFYHASHVESEPKRWGRGAIAACFACAAREASILRAHDVVETR